MIPTRTLSRFILSEEKRFPHSTGELTDLLVSISLGVKIISQIVATAGFKGLHGYSNKTNVHGDRVHSLDEEADEVLVQLLGSSGHFGLLVSEERNSVVSTEAGPRGGKYVLAFDPLDGSSNIGSNIPTGTIFCILRRRNASDTAGIEDFLQSGSSVVAAGYAVYGAKTSFVYSAGDGVHGFTLDPSIGEFILTHERISIPREGNIFSVNEGNTAWWTDRMKSFITEIKDSNKTAETPYTGRYVGSLIADFDRTIKKGGIFLYPRDNKRPQGRLRFLYECLPLAFIMEQSGGIALDDDRRVMEIVPADIHEKCGFVAGSAREMEWYRRVVFGN